ncbi:MAG: 4-(cytidine 5'-diphospho)-2-C-methyl-D-erythritol kinase [Robiginitomaculum sp.]|nr:4-(cytidine 5'-diphospho)-2-C-methyl-D-erythritol kinase [Robiginitomaculum sp.]
MIKEFAPAKINLTLKVGSLASDGYHPIDSLVAFADIGDDLHFEETDCLSLDVQGDFSQQIPAGSDNLVMLAAKELALHLDMSGAGAKIILIKNLPIASGIGGGSADAAATLRGLNLLWNGGLSPKELAAVGSKLGSDIPVCVLGSSGEQNCIRMRGRGEVLQPMKGDPPFDALLVNPLIAVSTAEVFGKFDQLDAPEKTGKYSKHNDLTAAAIELEPVIEQVLDVLGELSSYQAQMCGSGASCFVKFADRQAAKIAKRLISSKYPAWWAQMVKIGV